MVDILPGLYMETYACIQWYILASSGMVLGHQTARTGVLTPLSLIFYCSKKLINLIALVGTGV